MGSGMDFIYLSEDDGMTQAELPGGVSFLLFSVFHAILPIVVKPIKTRSYKGFADFRRKPSTYGI